MPFEIVRYESTPNPNALKCWLDRPISSAPRSFLKPEDAHGVDALADSLFEQAGLTTLLFNGDWMTINKHPDAKWSAVKQAVQRVLAEAP